MLFRLKRVRRDPYGPLFCQAEKPIRLDEMRLAAWARALGQKRDITGKTFGKSVPTSYVWHVEADSSAVRRVRAGDGCREP